MKIIEAKQFTDVLLHSLNYYLSLMIIYMLAVSTLTIRMSDREVTKWQHKRKNSA